jgi:adenylate cyclase
MCGAPSPVGSSFCDSCGSPLAAPSSPGGSAVDSGERKQVSVLFADVVGSMVLAE